MGKFMLEKDHKKLQGPIKDTIDTKAQELRSQKSGLTTTVFCVTFLIRHRFEGEDRPLDGVLMPVQAGGAPSFREWKQLFGDKFTVSLADSCVTGNTGLYEVVTLSQGLLPAKVKYRNGQY